MIGQVNCLNGIQLGSIQKCLFFRQSLLVFSPSGSGKMFVDGLLPERKNKRGGVEC
ncbi:MAG: hypothetical protein GYA24_14430 [Candidatus Lokiarchaeota archaeon]|nr:hypothetical protein [Candidatus Lokiarchaeota archaeon]